MKKSVLYISLLLITSLFVTACGGSSVNEPPPPSPTAVSGSAISESQENKGMIPSKIAIKNPYYDESEAAFIIKKQNSQEYQAEINLCIGSDDAGEQPRFNWELYLEMADEIREISGATIISHEGTHYRIRGKVQEHSPRQRLR